MFMSRSDYDRGVNTFSPEGRLIQVEYALEAIKLGATAIGIRCMDGVVLAVEKRSSSPLVVRSSTKKIFEIDRHMGCVLSGLVADGTTMIDYARVEAQNYFFTYNEPAPVEAVVQSLSRLALSFAGFERDKKVMSRPFGVALLIGSCDENGPKLYHLDASGTFIQYSATAIGAASVGAQSSLAQLYRNDLTVEEGIKTVIKILKEVMEEKVTINNVEIAYLMKDQPITLVEDDVLEKLIESVSEDYTFPSV